MSLDRRLADQVLDRLKRDYALRETSGAWMRGGKCPKCGKKELFARADDPKLIICGRKDKCGYEEAVKELYGDLFDDCSAQTRDDPNPTAAADFYLQGVRGFNLMGLRGSYSQELYQDKETRAVSATVRFPLPNDSWWERIIDQPGRFRSKANFKYKSEYGGHVWSYPDTSIADYAAADQIWLVEGIFDTIALEQGDFKAARDPEHPVHTAGFDDDGNPAIPAPVEQLRAASLMSAYNWPEHFLRELRIAIAAGPTPTRSPLIVFALDLGAAGTEYTRKFVRRARAEGWNAAAAQVRLDDDPGAKLDWNDLFLRKRLGHDARADYRWAGDVLVAADEREKAYLIWRKKKWNSFPFTFDGRTWWATLSEERVKARIEEGFSGNPELSVADYDVKYDFAARETISVSMIANCTFRALYFERNVATDNSAYWLRIDRPGDWSEVKASFPGSALAGSGDFKKRMMSVANGAIWTGDQFQLDRIAQRQLPVRDVTGIEFTGYCREHGAYVFGDLAVSKGRVHQLNEDGYFDIGKAAIKLSTAERILDSIKYDPDRLDQSWLPDFWTAFGARGMVVLGFACGLALFAEQLRQKQQSLGFLEITGVANSGKTTVMTFAWKLLGRFDYEGFDAAKSTQAGIARELAKAANLPVVFIEGDRNEDTPHSKRFDWEETKTLFNGRATRTRGVKSEGLETYSPPFRGGFVIIQNESVNASPAVLERIMAVTFDKSGWTTESKAAARRIQTWPIKQVSGYIVHAARREAAILERYDDRFAHHEARLLQLEGVNHDRLALNHAQLAAMIDALPIVLTDLRREWIDAAQQQVERMCIERHLAVANDHPHVQTFWERYEWLEQNEHVDHPINHSRFPDKTIAISLNEFEERCASRRLSLPPMNDLRKALKTSRRYPFVGAGSVNSVTGKTIHCWIFNKQATGK
ncbi:MAG: bifunctional DNA primase/helicase [Sphingomonas sp.]|nr:bifunctional DNA primase/helicase [Sphingomonas sp.]